MVSTKKDVGGAYVRRNNLTLGVDTERISKAIFPFQPEYTWPARLLSRLNRRFVRNISAAVVGQIISVFAQFGPVPVLIANWGVERYGHWLIAVSAQAFLSVIEGGLGVGYQRRVIHEHGSPGQLEATINQGVLLHYAVGGLALVLTSTVFILLIIVDVEKHAQIATLIVGLCVSSSLSLMFGGVLLVLRGKQQHARASLVVQGVRLIEVLLICAMALLGYDEIHVILSIIAWKLLLNATSAPFVLRKFATKGAPRLELSRFDFSPVTEGLGTMLQPAYLALSLQGSLQMVGASMGGAAAAAFGLARTLSRVPLQATIPLLAPAMIEFADAYGKRDVTRLKNTYIRINIATAAIVFMGGALVCIFSGRAIDLLGRSQIHVDTAVLFMLCAGSAFSAQSLCVGQLLIGTGRFLYFGLLGVVLSLVLVVAYAILPIKCSLTLYAGMYTSFELVLLLFSFALCRKIWAF